jgi:hypothetical protein
VAEDPLFDRFAEVDWTRSCDECRAPRAIRLEYFLRRDPSQEPNARSARALEFVAPLRFGCLFRCRVCGRPWYDAVGGLCTSVQRSWVPLVSRWNSRSLPLTAQQLVAAGAIGAVRWPVAQAEVRVPCRARAHGQWHDPALLVLQNRPLLLWQEPAPALLFIDEVVAIEGSEFALAHELRQQGIDTPERAMGWAPHRAYWGDEPVELNGLVELWGERGRMGIDLTRKPTGEPWKPRAKEARDLSEHPLIYVIADMIGDVDLLLPVRPPG